MKAKKIFIGTSGWSNKCWTDFYPPKTRSADYLSIYAQSFDSTEINSSFYRMPRASTISGWIDKVPADFKFCAKLSNYLTHNKRLREPEEPMQRFTTTFAPMKDMMGPVLIQLPPSLQFHLDIVDHFYELLSDTYRDYSFAIEPRHISWYTSDSFTLMEKHNIANVISESGGRFAFSDRVTAQNIYVRFHGPDKLYGSPHTEETLQEYATKIKKWKREGHIIWVFFNNTMYQDAINNARTLMRMLGM